MNNSPFISLFFMIATNGRISSNKQPSFMKSLAFKNAGVVILI